MGRRSVLLVTAACVDFGSLDRHGYRRIIPKDFGVPTDITASSPDAPDDLLVESRNGATQIRIGDRATATCTGS